MTRIRRTLLTALGAMVAAGGVGAAAYWGVFLSEQTETAAKESSSKAFDFDKGQVRSVTLTARGQTVVAQRTDASWSLSSPVSAPGDAAAWNAIVDRMAELQIKDTVADNHDSAADFGLAEAGITAVVELTDGRKHQLKLGDESSFDQSVYFDRGGDVRIHLATPGLKVAFDKSLLDLRDRTVVPFKVPQIAQASIDAPELRWALRKGQSGWDFIEPAETGAADSVAVETWLGRLEGLRATGFSVESAPIDMARLAEFGLDRPLMAIRLQTTDEASAKTLAIGAKSGDSGQTVFARIVEGGPVVQLETSVLGDLRKTVEDLRDKTVMRFERKAVVALAVQAGASGFKIQRSVRQEGDDEVEEFSLDGRPDKVRSWKVSGALYALGALKATSLVEPDAADLAKYGLQAPRLTFTVTGAEDVLLARLLVGNESGSKVYVTTEGSRRVWAAEKTTIDDLPGRLDDVIEAPAVQASP